LLPKAQSDVVDGTEVFPITWLLVLAKVIVAGLLALSLTRAVCAKTLDDSLLAYAVNVRRTPAQSWSGYGVYLGKGLFITAAHVVGHGWWTRPKIVSSGQEYPTSIVKEGSFEGTDLTLLSVEETLLPFRLRLRRMAICTTAPSPGEDVVTVIPGAVVHSHVISPKLLPADVQRFGTAIADVAQTGNSGSGVFDAQRQCLLGIMSRKISLSQKRKGLAAPEVHDIAKYFVPAAEISAFMAKGN
jgi:hypothetical protein